MKIVYKLMVFAFLLMSCQSDKKQDSNSKSVNEKQAGTKEKNNTTSKDSKSNIILTEAQFKDFFPKEIGDYKLENVSVLMSSAVASAMYLKNKDYAHSMTYNLEDCNRKGAANVKNFIAAYKTQGQGAPGTEYIYKERDGHKTIAFLQPKINHVSIRFIYNNRFRLSLGGFESDDVLWKYIQNADLQKLDKN